MKGHADTLLATPLRGRDLVVGGLANAVLRGLPVLAVGTALCLLRFRPGYEPAAALASLVLFASLLLLAHAVSLWALLVATRVGERTAFSFTAFLGIVAGTGLMASRAPGVASWHPLHAWFAQGAGAASHMLGAAGAAAALSAVLIAGFCASFRRLAAGS